MFLRWLIRGFFIGLLVLCVGGWVWSYVPPFNGRVSYDGKRYLCGAEMRQGYGSLGFVWKRKPTLPEGFAGGPLQELSRTDYHLLGFAFIHTDSGIRVAGTDLHFGDSAIVHIPFWFFTLLLSLALFYVWRKTRMRNPPPGFPVEMPPKQVTGASL